MLHQKQKLNCKQWEWLLHMTSRSGECLPASLTDCSLSLSALASPRFRHTSHTRTAASWPALARYLPFLLNFMVHTTPAPYQTIRLRYPPGAMHNQTQGATLAMSLPQLGTGPEPADTTGARMRSASQRRLLPAWLWTGAVTDTPRMRTALHGQAV